MKTLSYVLPVLALLSLGWTGYADTWQSWAVSIVLTLLAVKVDDLATRY